jgi:hypothetical protein
VCHAAVGAEHGHKGPSREVAHGLGLEGKMTATTEGDLGRHQPAVKSIPLEDPHVPALFPTA